MEKVENENELQFCISFIFSMVAFLLVIFFFVNKTEKHNFFENLRIVESVSKKKTRTTSLKRKREVCFNFILNVVQNQKGCKKIA